jgi:hypothetical protein
LILSVEEFQAYASALIRCFESRISFLLVHIRLSDLNGHTYISNEVQRDNKISADHVRLLEGATYFVFLGEM